jgi:hypothetical protein
MTRSYRVTLYAESSPEATAIRAKVREINNHVQAGKPCYWDRTTEASGTIRRRHRVFRARFSKGKFQIQPLAPQKWLDASVEDNFEFYR